MDASAWLLVGFAVIMLACCVGPMLMMRRKDKAGGEAHSKTHKAGDESA